MRRMVVVALVLGMAFAGFTQFTLAEKAKKPAASAARAVDKAYLQKIWDGWASLDVAGQKQYYAQGPHVFFDIAPLKYASWDEYQAGATKLLADYSSGHCTVNDDAQIHKSGDGYWSTSTVACDLTHKSGKRDMMTMRWTAVLEKQDRKWLIVHEHVSEAIQ